MRVMTTLPLAADTFESLPVSVAALHEETSAARPRLMNVDTFSQTVDDLLLARARKGDSKAVEQLFRLFEVPVYTLSRRLMRSSHDAEDVLQETFVEVIRSLGSFRGDGSFAGWVRRITVTKALQRLRRARPHDALDDELADHDSGEAGSRTADAVAARVDLESALQELSDTARTVLWLHDVEGYSHEEIGALWGRSPSFSKSQLARAYARMRGRLLGPQQGGAMHPRLEDLLAFRDGDATADVAAHLETCRECQDEVTRLTDMQRELQALPALEPGARPACRRSRGHPSATGQPPAGGRRLAAACLALAFTMTTAVRGGIEAYREARITREARSLIAESQRLEGELLGAGDSHTMLSGRKAGTIADIENRITAVDARLASIGQGRPSQEAVQLWQERVHLLGALADVQSTRTSYVGL